ncbi:MAG: DUF3240 family protein [Pseudomonadota bacterium]
MNRPDCCLTMVFPKGMEENLVDHLLEHHEIASGFTTIEVEGHGQGAIFQSIGERVRGRARRVQMQAVLNRADAQTLVQHLKETLPSPEVAYWITPIEEFGRLA